jgi:hypothetical protein
MKNNIWNSIETSPETAGKYIVYVKGYGVKSAVWDGQKWLGNDADKITHWGVVEGLV